jgi:hypothetical protein
MDEEIPHLSSNLLSDTQTEGCTVHTAQLREIYAWAPAHSFSSGTRSYKRDVSLKEGVGRGRVGAKQLLTATGPPCPQAADPLAPPLRVAKTGRNLLNEEFSPLLPTGIGERF